MKMHGHDHFQPAKTAINLMLLVKMDFSLLLWCHTSRLRRN
jgi:hypothetical protein